MNNKNDVGACQKAPLFALLTDFGFDFAVASMKGLLVTAFDDARIIDVDHSIEKFNVVSGAFVVGNVREFFPPRAMFICIVDPGVGSARASLCVEYGDQVFFGPNNGLFHYLLRGPQLKAVYRIDESYFDPRSNTFHGRDLFVPAAIAYAQSADRAWLTPFNVREIIYLEPLDNAHVVAYTDSFGNIKTNIPSATFSSSAQRELTVTTKAGSCKAIFARSFSDVSCGQLICYAGSNGTIEIAVRQGSARDFLGVRPGDTLSIK